MSTELDKRSIDSVLTKYELEPDLKDVYVEGEDDRSFYSQHYGCSSNKKVQFIDISSIDFSSSGKKIEEECFEKGNRDKLIYLINYLTEQQVGGARGIIDKDILAYTRGLPENSYIWLTDYGCLEMYFFSEACVSKVQKNTLKKVTNKVVEEIMTLLQIVTAVRIVEKQKGLSLKKPDLCKFFTVKTPMAFDKQRYMNALFLNENSRYLSRKDDFLKDVESCLDKVKKNDLKENLNGHDFVSVLTCFIRKNEKDFNHMDEMCVSAVYKNAVETAFMAKTGLFEKLLAF